jgi:hypothetical protein
MKSSCQGRAEAGRLMSWVFWRRPRSYWSVVVYHLPLAVLTGVALILPYAAAMDQLPLIPCTFRHLTGWPCPLCGFTRSFWAIATGQWGFALYNCPLALGVWLCTALVFLWNAAAMIFGVVLLRGPRLQYTPARRRKIAGVVLLLFLLNWIYRLAAGLT